MKKLLIIGFFLSSLFVKSQQLTFVAESIQQTGPNSQSILVVASQLNTNGLYDFRMNMYKQDSITSQVIIDKFVTGECMYGDGFLIKTGFYKVKLISKRSIIIKPGTILFGDSKIQIKQDTVSSHYNLPF